MLPNCPGAKIAPQCAQEPGAYTGWPFIAIVAAATATIKVHIEQTLFGVFLRLVIRNRFNPFRVNHYSIFFCSNDHRRR
jgi:hypothetical protein